LIVASVIGTISFIFLLIFHSKVNMNVVVVMAVFPIALIAAGYSIYRGEQRFLVITDKRILSKPGWGDTMVISLDCVVSSRIRYNWLMLMSELEIKHDLPLDMAPRRSALVKAQKRIKADYIDSVQYLETYHRFLQTRIQGGDREDDDL
jgi:amino acid transporter